jgi:predicted nucleic acid-binding protein
VVGTIGLLEQASARGLIDLLLVLAHLRQTNARLDPELIRAALARDQARQRKR